MTVLTSREKQILALSKKAAVLQAEMIVCEHRCDIPQFQKHLRALKLVHFLIERIASGVL